MKLLATGFESVYIRGRASNFITHVTEKQINHLQLFTVWYKDTHQYHACTYNTFRLLINTPTYFQGITLDHTFHYSQTNLILCSLSKCTQHKASATQHVMTQGKKNEKTATIGTSTVKLAINLNGSLTNHLNLSRNFLGQAVGDFLESLLVLTAPTPTNVLLGFQPCGDEVDLVQFV